MSEVLVGQAYHLRFDPKLWEAMEPYPPLGSLYAAAVLREEGLDVAFHDSMLAESPADWERALEIHRPRFAVLYEDNFNYLSKMCLLRMREAAFEMIDAARAKGCTVLVCGSDATDRAGAYLRAGADVVLLGEGEKSLVEVVRGRREVDGTAVLRNGTVAATPRRPVIRDVDALPFPAWDLVDMERYRGLWTAHHGRFSLNMVTSRGCPFHCNWCAKPIWGQRYNARTPENVASELEMLKARYDPDHIWFMDDMMGIKPGWMDRFADLVERKGIRTPFKSLNRVDLLLRDGEIDALRRAGCEIVWTGVESGSQKILDAMDKGIGVEQIREASRRLRAAGIGVGFFLQFGYPGETRADIEQTFQLVRDCLPDRIGMSVSYPLPGTKFYEAVRSQLGGKQNWTDSDDLAMMYRGPFATQFYRRLHTALHKEHRMRKAAARLKQCLRRSGGYSVPREAAAMIYHAVSLPTARLRMEIAARRPHEGIGALKGNLLPRQAAVPTVQESTIP